MAMTTQTCAENLWTALQGYPSMGRNAAVRNALAEAALVEWRDPPVEEEEGDDDKDDDETGSWTEEEPEVVELGGES